MLLRRFSRDNSCSNIFFHNSLRDLYFLSCARDEFCPAEAPHGIHRFLLPSGPFGFSAFITHPERLDVQMPISCSALAGRTKNHRLRGYRVGEDYTTNCVRSDFYNHTTRSSYISIFFATTSFKPVIPFGTAA